MSDKKILNLIEETKAAHLTTLNLARMELSSLPPEIGGLTDLKQLILSHNNLETIPSEIGNLSNLEILELGHNRLNQLTPELFQLSRLIRLGISHNELTNLPTQIGKLKNLHSFSLGQNQIEALPPEIGELTELTTLTLHRANIVSFPAEMRHLTKLIELSLIRLNNHDLLESLILLPNLRTLVLTNSSLTTLPSNLFKVATLEKLVLSGNNLITLSPEIALLTNLTELALNSNQLTSIPGEIGALSDLKNLDLSSNRLTAIPSEIGRLKKLRNLELDHNQLSTLPKEIENLSNLNVLDISGNGLSTLPEGIGRLTKLPRLDLNGNKLSSLPSSIGNLSNLRTLNAQKNNLKSIPSEIGNLNNLVTLSLASNQLTSIPKEIGNLANLKTLNLYQNELRELPPEIGRLSKLQLLNLGFNELASIPSEIGGLNRLYRLNLRKNHLSSLPIEIGHLNLKDIDVSDNRISFPPPEIVEQGQSAMMAFLRESLKGGARQWVSKVLVVGEGGVGKTSLLRAMRGEAFDVQESTTHGIEIGSLVITHPSDSNVQMQLNTWDFGGQEIYHATHQFFLTNRSLFVLVWNARLGFEQGKLYYWLDTIKARAPESPVLLVATFTDEREANIPLSDLQRKYPQIINHCDISNKTGSGIEDLRQLISRAAASLPLMGEVWPSNWLDAANELRSKSFLRNYITPNELWELMGQRDVTHNKAELLAQWLHELGDILFFQEDEELNDTVILNPQWVTESISQVLESPIVIENLGLFTRDHMSELWSDIDPPMRDHFLRLMEKFDLSYRTLENRDISLVVERLSLDPPDYQELWNAVGEQGAMNEIKMKFLLNTTMPAGIPTWFIARTHRFTTRTHWRYGALFTDGPERKHLGLIQASPHDRYLTLTVRGSMPHNFFALLRDGLELTLNRFPGLKIDRKVPCLGHNGESCSHEFDLAHLQARIERVPPKPDIECPVAFENVSVPRLLFGLHWNTINEELHQQYSQILSGVKRLSGKVEEMTALMQREFIKMFRREQAKVESYCPNVFVLRPRSGSWLQSIYKQKIDLQLYCQEPGEWHMTETGGLYIIDQPADWLAVLSPYLQRMVSVLKYATPLVGPWIGVQSPDHYKKAFENDIKLMEELVKKLPEIEAEAESRAASEGGSRRLGYSELSILIDESDLEHFEGASLRILRKLLDEKDTKQQWGGLRRVLTPEGHYLWLCEHHARKYLQ